MKTWLLQSHDRNGWHTVQILANVSENTATRIMEANAAIVPIKPFRLLRSTGMAPASKEAAGQSELKL